MGKEVANIFEHIKHFGSDEIQERQYKNGTVGYYGNEFFPVDEPEPAWSQTREHRQEVLRQRLENGEELFCADDVVQLADAHRESGRKGMAR
jgi:hypothetical protein